MRVKSLIASPARPFDPLRCNILLNMRGRNFWQAQVRMAAGDFHVGGAKSTKRLTSVVGEPDDWAKGFVLHFRECCPS